MNKYILITIIFVMLITLFINFPTQSLQRQQLKVLDEDLKEKISITKRLPESIKNKPNKSILKKKDTALGHKVGFVKEVQFYEILSLEEASLIEKPMEGIKPINAIRIKRSEMEGLSVGDILILNDIEGLDFSISITNVEKHNDGIVSYIGVHSDEGIEYITTITQSDNESFMTFATENGIYEMESKKGIGYIYKASAIREHLQEAGKRDFIVMPIPKR